MFGSFARRSSASAAMTPQDTPGSFCLTSSLGSAGLSSVTPSSKFKPTRRRSTDGVFSSNDSKQEAWLPMPLKALSRAPTGAQRESRERATLPDLRRSSTKQMNGEERQKLNILDLIDGDNAADENAHEPAEVGELPPIEIPVSARSAALAVLATRRSSNADGASSSGSAGGVGKAVEKPHVRGRMPVGGDWVAIAPPKPTSAEVSSVQEPDASPQAGADILQEPDAVPKAADSSLPQDELFSSPREDLQDDIVISTPVIWSAQTSCEDQDPSDENGNKADRKAEEPEPISPTTPTIPKPRRTFACPGRDTQGRRASTSQTPQPLRYKSPKKFHSACSSSRSTNDSLHGSSFQSADEATRAEILEALLQPPDEPAISKFVETFFNKYATSFEGRMMMNCPDLERFFDDFVVDSAHVPSRTTQHRLYADMLELQQDTRFRFGLSLRACSRGLCYESFQQLLDTVLPNGIARQVVREAFDKYAGSASMGKGERCSTK
eukprot:gnl/TRDRNA2_/TRDRNA2_80614_c0_seq1.p1 gnl/TRDRNA2_/TRDRNA2_80614_c0~~gnl/TRDRNA2_/TRDRNA2_80614_c0_seq1.p1  ORF type:complete len:495 (+),score=67.16 gnl/TRDRNA2_/TRDRNA2_80614_c0_seq1:88-1572(+)